MMEELGLWLDYRMNWDGPGAIYFPVEEYSHYGKNLNIISKCPRIVAEMKVKIVHAQ